MQFLVASNKHALLPFAWRLQREDHSVDVIVHKPRYRAAWEPKIPKVNIEAGLDETLQLYHESVMAGDMIVLTDVRKVRDFFTGAPRLYAQLDIEDWGSHRPPLAMGGWFDGATWRNLHWLVLDWGLWPGGHGPSILAGATMIRQEPVFLGPEHWFGGFTESLIAQNFSGLVTIGLRYNDEHEELQPVGITAGWPWLHSHLFVAGVDNLGGVLGGEHAKWRPESRTFTVGLSVTQPPWPYPTSQRPATTAIKNVSSDVVKETFFHDITLDGPLSTASLDGLVAVVTSSANTSQLARTKALAFAEQIRFPERQARSDVGAGIEQILVGLESKLKMW
jgi:hypothetical protein